MANVLPNRRLRAAAGLPGADAPGGGRFEVVAGERRLRAAKLLQWSSIACRVAELSDLDAEVDKVVENEQRCEPTPLERARAYAHLRDAFKLDQEEIAARVGVHKSVVSRALGLLRQPDEIQKLSADESISPGHLRSLESVADESKRVEIAAQAAKEQLTVEETRRRAREATRRVRAKPRSILIASPPAESARRVAKENRTATAASSSEAGSSAAVEATKRVPEDSASSGPLVCVDPIVKPSAAIEKLVADEISRPAPIHASKPLAPTEIQKIAIDESISAPPRRSAASAAHPEMAERGGHGERGVDRKEGRFATRGDGFATAGESLPALCPRPLGPSMEGEARARGGLYCAFR